MFTFFTYLADTLTYQVLQLSAETHLAQAVHFFIEDSVKIFFLLTSLMLMIGFLRSWISPEKIRHWLEGQPRYVAYFLAAILGAITPFCSCSSIPLFIAFLSSGIPLGVTMAFLITSPMINEVAAVLFGEAIGWYFTFLYIGVGLATGILGGVLIDFFKLDKWVDKSLFNKPKCGCCKKQKSAVVTLKQRFKSAWDETIDVLNSVWLYVFIGIAIGAGIHGYVPQEWFIAYAGVDNLFAVPLAVIAAVPLYANVTGTVPVAEVLIEKGLPVGTTLAFIMSTVAISLPELIILKRVLNIKMLAVFVAYLTVAFILLGYGFNMLFE